MVRVDARLARSSNRAAACPRGDPRRRQAVALSLFLAAGVGWRAFDVTVVGAGTIVGAALLTQALAARIVGVRFDPLSPLITALSLTLLLRAESPLALGLAAVLAVGSKFVLRAGEGAARGHVFNPANFGIVVLLLLGAGPAPGLAWTTPGQWGTALWLGAAIVGLGAAVAAPAARLDAALVFLGVFAGLSFLRAAWLGDPVAIPLHRLQNGALLLFAFFMITDPRTTPVDPVARAAFAAAVAGLGFVLIHVFFLSDGVFYALAAVCALRGSVIALAPRLSPADPYKETRPCPPSVSS